MDELQRSWILPSNLDEKSVRMFSEGLVRSMLLTSEHVERHLNDLSLQVYEIDCRSKIGSMRTKRLRKKRLKAAKQWVVRSIQTGDDIDE